MNSAALVLLSLSALTAHMLPPGDHVRELRVVDQIRSYSVHIPPSYNSRRPSPVVLVFHSAMMNGAMMARFCGLSEKADRSGFVVVYANGTGSTPVFLFWDAGGVRGRVSDDVGYAAKLLDDLSTVVNVDPKRVFATGMSNGAMMCYRLAAEPLGPDCRHCPDCRDHGDRELSAGTTGVGTPLPRDQGWVGALRRPR